MLGETIAILVGVTQISFGCPGPVRETGPSCNPWHPFAHARLAVERVAADGTPVPGTRRFVVSDDAGRFRLRLAAGAYEVERLPQAHTRGGAALHVRVRAGGVTRVVVRFEGYPQML